jgi:LPXTG-motif cell wall-anchored protein
MILHQWIEFNCGDKNIKAEHSYVTGVVTKEATTKTEGEKTFTCSCGYSYTESIAKLASSNNGCGGSIIASIFGVLALAGSVIVLRKKREE